MKHIRMAVLLVACSACRLTSAPLKPTVILPVPQADLTPSARMDLSGMIWSDIRRDPVAVDIVRTALAENRDARIAALRVEQARQQVRAATGALLPAVDAGTRVSWTDAGGRSGTSLSASVELVSWEVDLFGRLRSDRSKASEQYLSSEAAERGTRLSLIANVSTQYYAVLRADSQRQLAERTLVVLEDLLQLTQALVRAGQTSELDLRAAEAQVQQARISALTASREAELARNALDVLAGRPVQRRVRPDSLSWAAAPEERALPAAIPSELLLRRPDLARAEHDLLAANADVAVARAAFFPRITMTGSGGTTSGSLSSLFGGGTGVWSFVPSVSVPLFRGGRNRAALASARAGEAVALAQYEQAIQIAFREAADAITSVGNYAQVLQRQRALIDAQRQRFELAALRYRLGEDAYLPVITAQQDYLSAQQSYIDTNYSYIASRLQLAKALGGEPEQEAPDAR